MSKLKKAISAQFLPSYVKRMLRVNASYYAAVNKLESIAGKEQAQELINQFSNEAFATPNVVNANYIISKINSHIQLITS